MAVSQLGVIYPFIPLCKKRNYSASHLSSSSINVIIVIVDEDDDIDNDDDDDQSC